MYLNNLKRLSGSFLQASTSGIRWACIFYCTMEYVADFVVCSGPSMEPTIFTADLLITEHVSVLGSKVCKGDIVTARSPSNPRQFICKRVIGVPGDKMDNSLFSRNIPKGHVWLEGDNKSNSTDSRSYGPVPIGLLRGRAVCKVWPAKDATVF